MMATILPALQPLAIHELQVVSETSTSYGPSPVSVVSQGIPVETATERA